MKKNYILLTIALFAIVGASFGQQKQFWTNSSETSINLKGERQIVPEKYRTLKLNIDSFKSFLAQAPLESPTSKSAGLVASFPMPDGSIQEFMIVESPVMEPELAEEFPNMKTYLAQGIDDASATMRFDITHKGFHGMILSPNGAVFIDPYSSLDTENYVSYYKKDYKSTKYFTCEVAESINNLSTSSTLRAAFSNGANLREYRFAGAATGEYTSFHGGTVADGQAAIVTTINRVNTVYELDLAIRLIIVANNSSLIYTNSGSDPFSNNDTNSLINESQTEIDGTIGDSNYDIGHTFSTGAGGLAGLGVVCRTGQKARGVTGTSNPVGDPFDIDFVAHEVGHQFSGSHTFNGSSGNCAGGNRNASTAFEPGSGSTIQAYAGICSPQNLQNNSDPYFHVGSLEEMITYSTSGAGNGCPTIIATGNTPPVASTSMPAGLTIPANTPFELTGSGMDANGDLLTYCWEQYDLGPQGAPDSPSGNAPLFRTWNPTTNPVRTFPKLSDLLNNTIAYGEILPTYTRSMNFRLTLRDNRAGGGGVHCASYAVDVSNTSGPFLVLSPNTGITWNVGSTETVTWDVANTTAAPVSCANVDILLSTDGGLTYPVTLASGVTNDGSHDITVTNNVTTSARIKVIGSGNIFFDISNTNFAIEAGLDTFTMDSTPTTADVCETNSTNFTLNLTAIAGFNSPVTLSTSVLPIGATASFSVNPVTPTAISVLTINSGTAVSGNYSITVTGTGGGETITTDITLNILSGTLSAPTQISPTDGATDIAIDTPLSWSAVTDATSYTIEVATDVAFTNIVYTESGITTTNTTATGLSANTQYFWRVLAANSCGTGPNSIIFDYTTETPPACTNEISESDFEAGANSAWSESSSNGFQIVDNTSGNYNSGSWSAWLGRDDNESSQVWQSVSISPTAISATLTYYYLLASNEAVGDCIYDFAYLDINGTNETTYALCADTNTTGYVLDTVDLSAYIGTTIEIRFRVTTDNFANSSSSVFIDDLELEVCESTLSTEDNTLAGFTLFPNPNNGSFTIKAEGIFNDDIQVTVFDIAGRQIFNESYVQTGSFDTSIQLQAVQSGLYLVQIKSGEKSIIKKILVE